MPQFEIHWQFQVMAGSAECQEMVSRIRCLPDLAGCRAEVTDHQGPPNQIKLALCRWFALEQEASDFGRLIQGKIRAGLDHLHDTYYYVVRLAAPENGEQPH